MLEIHVNCSEDSSQVGWDVIAVVFEEVVVRRRDQTTRDAHYLGTYRSDRHDVPREQRVYDVCCTAGVRLMVANDLAGATRSDASCLRFRRDERHVQGKWWVVPRFRGSS